MARDAEAAALRGIDKGIKVPKKHNKKEWLHEDIKAKVNSKRAARFVGHEEDYEEDIRNYVSR